MDVDDSDPPTIDKPRLWPVVTALTAAAAVVSYLAAYAVADALVGANVLPAWRPDHDPRPRRMAVILVVLLAASAVAALLARINGRRHIRRIDQMDDAAEDAGRR